MRSAGAIVCFLIGSVLAAWGGIGDLLYSLTPEGGFGQTAFGNFGVFVYSVVFFAGVGLIVLGKWLLDGENK